MKVKESETAGLKLSIQKTKIMASSPNHIMANRWGNNGNSERLYFVRERGGSKIPADGDCTYGIERRLLLERKVMTILDGVLKQRYYFANKGMYSQSYGFSSSHVWM